MAETYRTRTTQKIVSQNHRPMRNITELEFCYGCGVCAAACPVSIISMAENRDGFHEPRIERQDLCTTCGMCIKVCSFCNDSKTSVDPKPYAAWSVDDKDRDRASSGGVSTELMKAHLESYPDGGKIIGVRYDSDTRQALHYVFDKPEGITRSMGSKYLPSLTETAFRAIDWREKDSRWLITGTPCQIASLRRLVDLKKASDRFLLIDFFCHGVPSRLLWIRYLKDHPVIAESDHIVWRDKENGWHDSYAISDYSPDGKKKYKSSWSEGDLFFTLFLGNTCLNRCCYETCRFKGFNSGADIRLGDFWGPKYSNDEKGVSIAIAMTAAGQHAIDSLSDKCIIEPATEADVLAEQMTSPMPYPAMAHRVSLGLLRAGAPLRSLDLIRRIFRHLPPINSK